MQRVVSLKMLGERLATVAHRVVTTACITVSAVGLTYIGAGARAQLLAH